MYRKIDREELRAFCKNHSKDEIINEFGHYGYVLCNKLRYEHLIRARSKNKDTDEKYQNYMSEYRSGMKVKDIAAKYHVSRQSIYNAIEEVINDNCN